MEMILIDDEQLVEQTRCGDKDAFSSIVKKYQSLICALTYGACGDFQVSEDLAQTTFIRAWCELSTLREPSKLKSWLCGIARNVINNSFRQESRTPTANACGLDEINDIPSIAPSPCDHIITKEEEISLWKAISTLSPAYREPLVLFYRQDQSITEVADVLGLTEDAVCQRLSRGRMLLTERIARHVECVLSKTAPTKAFSKGVIAALPALEVSGKTVSLGTVIAETAAIATKALSSVGLLVGGTISSLTLGSYFGCRMRDDSAGPLSRRKAVVNFWRLLIAGLAMFAAVPFMLTMIWGMFLRYAVPKDKFFAGLSIWLSVIYVIIPAALVLWYWQRRRRQSRRPEAGEREKGFSPNLLKLGIPSAVLGAACFLFVSFNSSCSVQHVSAERARQLIEFSDWKLGRFWIGQSGQGKQFLRFTMFENRKQLEFVAPVNESIITLLRKRDISCPTFVQGKDYEILGWPGHLLPYLCFFVLAIGSTFLLKKPKGKSISRNMTS